MFRYRNLLIALIVTLGIVTTGCSSTTETPVVAPTAEQATEAATTEEVQATAVASTAVPAFGPGTTITYIASQNWILASEMELAKQFEEETGVHVDFQIVPSDQYFNVLETKLEAGGEGIDIFGGQSGKTDMQLQLTVEKNAVALTGEECDKQMKP